MKIYCIEGLFSYHLAPLTKAVKSLNLGVEVVTRSWFFVQFRKPKLNKDDILIGHSFGGGEALKIWNTQLDGGKYLFLLDPRKGPLGFPDPKFVDYRMDGNSENYYQTGAVRGYGVRGAGWNNIITGYSHFNMPQNPKFLFKLMEVVKSHTQNGDKK